MERNLILSPISVKDLVAEIASEVTGRIYRDLNISNILNPKPEPEEKFTRKQLASYLKVTLPTIDRYRSKGVFPVYQTGRTIYFKKSEVDKALLVENKKGAKKMKYFNAPSESQNEGTDRITQLKTIFQYLEIHVATASMVSNATGVPQKNICRFKRDLQLANRLWELRKDICEHTGFKAWYLTANPQLKPNTINQLSLFNDFEKGNND